MIIKTKVLDKLDNFKRATELFIEEVIAAYPDEEIKSVKTTDIPGSTKTIVVVMAGIDVEVVTHSKGWYPTEVALVIAYPVGEAGDWAIVGTTDTIWIWDTDVVPAEWVDSGQGAIVNWGDVGGVVANQADLQAELDAKLNVTGSTVITVNTAIAGINGAVYISNSAAPLVHTLASYIGKDGYIYTISNINAGAVKIQCTGVETINGKLSVIIGKGEALTVRAYNGGWVII